jgi:acylphosphatase
MKAVKIKIYGLVQNVGFRFTAKKIADKLGIKGWVKNFEDGSVYIEAEGDKDKVEDFIEWCRRGPDSARVDEVMIEKGEKIQDFEYFSIEQ